MASDSHQCSVCGTPKSAWLDDNCPTCLMRLGSRAVSGESIEKLGLGTIRCLGDYELLEEIARGGMGVVYRARQASLNRVVAVKVLLGGHFANETFIKRFRHEAEAAASLNHPNIVSIYEVGEHEGQPYFSMELIQGRSLAELTRDGPLPARRAALLLKTIAEAVHFANERGLLHRDLKPSNVLVDSLDRPHITDFGLAKRVEGDADLTLTGQVLGTPNYMPPEQADPKRGSTTAASEVYSLGAVLYHLLCGRAPFLSQTVQATLRQVIEQDPVSLRLLNTTVPRDLETICLRCLCKEPGRRFNTARELADELGRWLEGRPILSRPAWRVEKVLRWCRRNPALSATGATAILAILLGFSGMVWQWRAADRHRQVALDAQANEARLRRQAETQEWAARKKAYASDMKLLQQALAADDLGRAQELLNRQRPQPGDPDMRGWEWRYYWQFCQSDAAFTLYQFTNSVISVSFSRDGTLLAAGTYLGHNVTVWDVASRQMVFRHEEANSATVRLAFAPQEDVLAYYTVSSNRSIAVWNSRTRTETHRLALSAPSRDLAFATGGMFFTIDRTSSSNITAWDVVNGTALNRFTARLGGSDMGTVFAVNGDGTRIAHSIAGASDFVRVFDVNEGFESRFKAADELVTALAFSADGRLLGSGSGYAEGAIKLWDVPSGRSIGSLEGHRSWVSCLKFLPDGKTLVSSSADRTIRFWDLETRQLLRTLTGRGGELWTIDVSPDGRWVASGGKDGSVILWDLTSSGNHVPAFSTLPLGSQGRWAFSADGKSLAVVRQHQIKLYDSKTLELLHQANLPFSNAQSIAVSPDSRSLLITDTRGNLGVWDMQHRTMVTNLAVHPGSAYITPGVSGRKNALTFGVERVFKEWDIATWQQLNQWSVDADTVTWGLSPAANRLATGTGNGLFELIPIDDPQKRRRFFGQPRIKAVDLSPDGKTFVAASENGTVEIWDADTLTRRALLHGALLGYHTVAISPDGERVAAGGNGQEAIKMWDLRSLEEVATLAGRGSFFADAGFSPDGSVLGARNFGWVLHLWRAPSWAEIESAELAHRPARAP